MIEPTPINHHQLTSIIYCDSCSLPLLSAQYDRARVKINTDTLAVLKTGGYGRWPRWEFAKFRSAPSPRRAANALVELLQAMSSGGDANASGSVALEALPPPAKRLVLGLRRHAPLTIRIPRGDAARRKDSLTALAPRATLALAKLAGVPHRLDYDEDTTGRPEAAAATISPIVLAVAFEMSDSAAPARQASQGQQPALAGPHAHDDIRDGNDAGADLAGPTLLIVTATCPSANQLRMLAYGAEELRRHALRPDAPLVWIVSEDAATLTPAVAALLASSGLDTRHIAVGPTHRKGNAQRNAAYELIRDQGLRGIVYNMDDDNAYAPGLWAALRELRRGRVGVLPVQLDVGSGYAERAVYDARGHFRSYIAGWCYQSHAAALLGPRLFCIDMGGFAFDATLLHGRASPLWPYAGRRVRAKRGRRRKREAGPLQASSWRIDWRGGESEFVQALMPSLLPEDLQPLANCCHDILVLHNGLGRNRTDHRAWVPTVNARVTCGVDGW